MGRYDVRGKKIEMHCSKRTGMIFVVGMVILVCVFFSTTACGKKADPKPPVLTHNALSGN